MSAWVLPDHIADVLPSEARHIEELRRELLDTARSYGYELVMPPLLEYIDSLLTGTGEALDLQTFKLVDQLSGRTMGLRADTTPQVARIDAHLLNRAGVTRLCYCGSVLHTHPSKPHATREPMQYGAEVFGHAGMEADIEVQLLAIASLLKAGVTDLTLDLGDARIVRALLSEVELSAADLAQIHASLAAKDADALLLGCTHVPPKVRESLVTLLNLYGDESVLDLGKNLPMSAPYGLTALSELKQIADAVKAVYPQIKCTFDLADPRGYAYYSGARFAIYTPGAVDALLRGGRYDKVGAVFGRNRPAAGFSVDLKELVACVPARNRKAAIRAPWSHAGGQTAPLRAAIARLREQGDTVICVLPGHENEVQEFDCDRALVEAAGQWLVQAI